MTHYVRAGTIAGAVVLTLGGVAQADTFPFDESTFVSLLETPLGSSFSGTWEYVWDGGISTTGLLTLDLTNDNSPGGLGGSITAIAFNTPGDVTLGSFIYDEFGGLENEAFFASDGTVGRMGSLGFFNTVYSVDGGSFGGAGNGNVGIEAGETGEFEWTVTSSSALSASTLSVLAFLDFDLNGHDPLYAMALKFKGLPGDDSETFAMVPLPPAAWFGAVGLVGVVVLRRRFLL